MRRVVYAVPIVLALAIVAGVQYATCMNSPPPPGLFHFRHDCSLDPRDVLNNPISFLIAFSICVLICWALVLDERDDYLKFLARTGLAPDDPLVAVAYKKLTRTGRNHVTSATHLNELLARRAQIEEERERRVKEAKERAEEKRLFWMESQI